MAENKAKIKKMGQTGPNAKKIVSSLLFAVVSLVFAGGLFAGLLYLESYFSTEVTYADVVTALVDIPEGEIITEENINEYFTVSQISVLAKTEGSLSIDDAKKLVGCKTRVQLYKGEEITEKDFEELNIYTDGIENPVEISVEVGSLAASDGGKIRAGDLVNITLMFNKEQLTNDTVMTNNIAYVNTEGTTYQPEVTVDEDEEIDIDEVEVSENEVPTPTSTYVGVDGKVVESTWTTGSIQSYSSYNFDSYSQYVLENIYVKKVLNADGAVIDPTDKDSIASVYIFVIPKAMELELNSALENCTSMRVSKILYKYEPENKEESKEDAEVVAEIPAPAVVEESPVVEDAGEEVLDENIEVSDDDEDETADETEGDEETEEDANAEEE